ncbi:MAG: DUF4010 domain-containing protein [Thermoanaerobaculia bacterium]|nr:MAG: DUF4010 domain-containing protein [Thermoanaerobaculia bacterium]
MTETQEILLRLAAAALGGLAVGIEREWSARRDADHSRFGGVRTFLLLGLAGGLAAAVGREDPRIGLVVLAGAAALVVVAYLVSAWKGTIDATTEVAAVVVLGAGLLAGTGRLVLASAVFALTALVLAEKGRMHAAVERIQSAELEAGARFAVLALVVLPLLPAEPWGPYGGIEPRRLWILVLIFAGLSFAGYIALRVAGPERGYGLAGLLGGVVSSTAVTLNFARESRGHESLARALGLGALAASTILPVRVLVLSGALNLEVARALAPAVLPALVAGAGAVALALRSRDRSATREEVLPGNPLRLGAAIQMTLLFVAVLLVLAAVRDRFGSAGLLGTSALLGLTDLDALTYSMSKLAASGTPAATAARALLIGMISNTLFKAALALALGAPAFRRVCLTGLAVFGAALGAGLLLI